MSQAPAAASERLLEALAGPMVRAADLARIGLSVTFVDSPDPVVSFINDAGVDLLGWSRDEILRTPATRLMSPAERQLRSDHQERRRGGESLPTVFETTVVRKDGTTLPIQVSIASMQIENRPAVVAFFFDVTERHRSHEALARSEARFRKLIEQAPEAVWVFCEGRLAFVNNAAVSMLRFPDSASLLQMRPIELIHESDRPNVLARADSMINRGASLEAHEYRTLTRDGGQIVVEVQSMPIEWEGKPSLLSFGRDVTARKEMEGRLMQSDRLAALGTLTAGIAHGLNNPLAYTLLGLEQAFALVGEVADRSPKFEELRRRLSEVRDGVERAATIVRQLKSFSRDEPEAPTAVDVRATVEAAARLVDNEFRHRGRLVIEPATDIPAVRGGVSRLEQAFLNLLVNAAHALTEANAATNEVRVSFSRGPEDDVVVEIRDNGAGMSPEVLGRAFDPFFTTKPVGVGTGLGLSICREIVSAYGGSIAVESTPGVGTTVRISLQVARGLVAAPTEDLAETAAPATLPDTMRPKPRALVVDDEPLIAEMIARMVQDRFDVTTVGDASRALELLTSGGPVDVIVCDLMMPGMTGMDLFHEATARDHRLASRFIFMTGGAFAARVEQFLASVKNPCLEKPFPIAKLRQALEPFA